MAIETLALAIGLLGTGAVAGLVAGLLGVGGGIVIVPVLFYVLPLVGVEEAVRMHVAVGTSLATIIATSIISARAHHKRGAVDFGLLKQLAPGILVGVFSGAVFGARAGGDVLTAIFAAIALIVAANMAFREAGMAVRQGLPARPWRDLIAFAIGGFSVVMGIGGGTLSVPILTLFGVPIRRAVATAAAIGVTIGIPGAIGFIAAGWGTPGLPPFSLGYANVLGFALIAPTSMLLAPRGAALAHTISPRLLRYAFALFLFTTSIRMALSVL
ncbi:MAG: sulfite exporter TauE/SafE family protein [Rhodospirillales bacterium]|nr:sulfite exporter TauE/SafE family protein [Rhodospirillales bacterium]